MGGKGSDPEDRLSDDEIKEILKLKHVAVVGASRDPSKPSQFVPKYLKEKGYRITPINPFADEILGEKCFKRLLEVPYEVDIAEVFRPSEQVVPIVEEAIRKGVKVAWMQEGIWNREAEEMAKEHGIKVVYDRCMMKEHRRLMG